MSKFDYYSMRSLVDFFLEQGKEGECWDFKQEWHDDMSALLKDIICFSNTVHDENCYIVFGVSDDLHVTGMKKTRRKQADIIEAISNLVFAGDNYPKISIQSIYYSDVEIDILVIYNTDKTPIYLKRAYGKMREGCVYLRVEDKNTPDNSNADIPDIENLWRKRLGLTKAPSQYIYDRMHNKLEWTENGNGFYNIFKPEYSIEIVQEDDARDADEFYCYAMSNKRMSFKLLYIKYQQTILERYEIALLDSGRLQVPVPEWGFIKLDEFGADTYSYKYYVLGSERYWVLTYLYDKENGDERDAFRRLKEVVLFYMSEEERVAFELYTEANRELIDIRLKIIDRFNYIGEKNGKVALYKQRLKLGLVLNELLSEWRETVE